VTEQWSHAAIYFSATSPSFWKWSENLELAWADGHTIAFLPELRAVLNRLAADGLPPLGSVLLLLAACRENWRVPPSRRELLAGVIREQSGDVPRPLLNSVCSGLDKVNDFPQDLRHSPAAKAELAALIFDKAPNRLDSFVSQAIVAALATWSDAVGIGSISAGTSYWLFRDLGTLRNGLARITEEVLRLRAETGLETMPAPAPIELPPLTGRAWLAWLEQQEEFAGLARLAKRLLAAIHIPRKLLEPEELPVGGITDIAPRGPLDRLLLSELAHDDLTLAVRVAMNEALYLRRESPPRSPPHQRHLVLDAGLRLWGLPRLYGTAVALALAAHHDPNLEVQIHRAVGAGLEPAVLNTPTGLRNHLAILDHRLHPGEALQELAELLKETAEGDAIIVTSNDTLDDPAFQRALERSSIAMVYLATVSRDGRFELVQQSRAGRKRLNSAELRLDEILNGPPQALRLRDDAQEQLPAIFHAQPFPLLLSVPVDHDNSWHAPELGLLTLAGDGRLLRWTVPSRGAEQLATGLPPGRIFGATTPTNDGDRICLVLGRLSSRGLCVASLSQDGSVDSTVPLLHGEHQVQAVLVGKAAVYVVTDNHVEALDLATRGYPTVASSQSTHLARLIRASSMYAELTTSDGPPIWYRIAQEANGLKLEIACRREFLIMFDARGIEGPLGITPQGDLYYTATGEIKPVQHGLPLPLRCTAVARDGLRFVLESGGRSALIHTLSRAAQPCLDVMRHLEPHLHLLAKPRSLRKRFIGVGVDAAGQLSLVTPKQTSWSLKLPKMEFPPRSSKLEFHMQPFEPWQHDDVAGFQLSRAKFADGSVAVLDRRGLLHLRSSDATIPECTIVLCEGPSSGWCADGRTWGPGYFLGQRAATSAETIARKVIGPFLERLQ
jgi:MoxR-vWA-beta-propeller ternary system domain bpX1/MoxR-vWA-beta-propeller ternary system domain bpX0